MLRSCRCLVLLKKVYMQPVGADTNGGATVIHKHLAACLCMPWSSTSLPWCCHVSHNARSCSIEGVEQSCNARRAMQQAAHI